MKFWEPLQKELEITGTPERAEQQKAYMRGQYEFYGIRAPEINSLFSAFFKEYRATSWNELKDQVRWAWEQPQREWQMIGMRYLQKMKKLWGDDLLVFAEEIILKKSWWDTIDFLATNVVGKYLEDKPVYAEQEMNLWNECDNMWKIRTSIIFQLKYKEKVNTEFLSKAILKHQDSKEFFIRKAQGWSLRQYSRYNPEWVKEFVNEHELSPLSVREATKYL